MIKSLSTTRYYSAVLGFDASSAIEPHGFAVYFRDSAKLPDTTEGLSGILECVHCIAIALLGRLIWTRFAKADTAQWKWQAFNFMAPQITNGCVNRFLGVENGVQKKLENDSAKNRQLQRILRITAAVAAVALCVLVLQGDYLILGSFAVATVLKVASRKFLPPEQHARLMQLATWLPVALSFTTLSPATIGMTFCQRIMMTNMCQTYLRGFKRSLEARIDRMHIEALRADCQKKLETDELREKYLQEFQDELQAVDEFKLQIAQVLEQLRALERQEEQSELKKTLARSRIDLHILEARCKWLGTSSLEPQVSTAALRAQLESEEGRNEFIEDFYLPLLIALRSPVYCGAVTTGAEPECHAILTRAEKRQERNVEQSQAQIESYSARDAFDDQGEPVSEK